MRILRNSMDSGRATAARQTN